MPPRKPKLPDLLAANPITAPITASITAPDAETTATDSHSTGEIMQDALAASVKAYDPDELVPQPHGGALRRGGKTGKAGPYTKPMMRRAMREITGKLLRQIDGGLASSGELAQRVALGEPRALETATRIFETLHDRAFGKPLPASAIMDDDESAGQSRGGHTVQIGQVVIAF